MSFIQGIGRNGANIFIVDDSATQDDVNSGYAISGAGEKTLRSMFRNHGVNLDETYRTLLIKERLDYNGNIKKRFKEAVETSTNRITEKTGKTPGNILLDELISVKPNIIVPLGELSFNSLTGQRSIYKYRGSILPIRQDIQSHFTDKAIKVIPTFGPQILNENYTARAYVNIDIGKAAKYQKETEQINPDGRLWVIKNALEFSNFLSRVKWDNNYCVFDIETTFGIPTCISFCFDGVESVCIPLLTQEIDEANKVLIWQLVAKILKSNIGKVNQNIKYDVSILERFGFKVNNIIGDTVLRSGLIYPELPKNLGFLTSIYTEMPYHKDEGRDQPDKNKLYLYCAKDSLATRRIYEAQKEELQELNLEFIYEKRIMPLFFIYKEMDENGILVDDNQRLKLKLKYEFLLEINTTVLKKLLSKEFNPRSPKQCGIVVYEELGYPIRKKDANYKTDEDTLEELLLLSECKYTEGPEILRLIILCRKIAKLLEYIDTPLHLDNRLRGSFNLAGTETGRTNCSKSLDSIIVDNNGKYELTQVGRSLQTITKHGFRSGDEFYGNDLRSMYVPSPGYIFVEADLSQAEARVDAVLAMNWDLLSRFDIPPGVHKFTAGLVLGKDPFSIQKGSLEYHLGKTVRHSAERNIGAKELALRNHISMKEAQTALNKIHEVDPSIREVFHKEIIKFVQENRYLVTPHGRRRQFFNRPDQNMYNEAISYIPQAVVSDQNKFSFLPIKEEMPQVRYLNETHDSSLVEIKKEELPLYVNTVKKHLETPIDFRRCSISRDFELTIPCEIEWSDTNWHEMRKLEF